MNLGVDVTYQRNLLLVKLLWGFYLIHLLKFLFDDGPLGPSAPVAEAGFVLITGFTVLALIKRYSAMTMYLSTFIFHTYFFLLLSVSPYPVNFVFVWLGLLLSAVYQNYAVVVIASSLSISMTAYFFPRLAEVFFPLIQKPDVFYLVMFGFFITVLLLLEIRHRKQLETRIEHLAYNDPLTDLPNRTLFRQLSNQMLARAKRDQQKIAVLFIDLDNFKSVNDRFGHGLGDDLLKTIAARLKEGFRASDLLCRVGGDEFVGLIEIKAEEEAAAAAKRISAIISRPLVQDSEEFSIRSSIGISVYPNDDEDIEALVRNADRAMYRAKADGGNRSAFYSA